MTGPDLSSAAPVASRPDVLVIVAAVLGPAVVVATFLAALWLHDHYDVKRVGPTRNGMLDGGLTSWQSVEAGQLSPSDLMAEMDDRMSAHPEVVVLGNSLAGTDDPELLARALGVASDKVAVLAIPCSVGAHWRGILEYGIIDKGYRPRLVIVQALLSNALMPASTPRPGALNDFWVSRTRLQRFFLAGLRDVPVQLFFPRQPNGKVTVGQKTMNHVFHPSRMDATLHGRSVPIADGTQVDGSRLINPEGHVDVDDSDVPRMVELTRQNGMELAWVVPAIAPGVGALGDQVRPDREARMHELVESAGGHMIDLRTLPMDDSHFFAKMDHATEDGMRRVVFAMSDALLRVGALGAGDADGILPAVEPTAHPHGDVIAAGSEATWSFPPWVAAPGRFEVRLLASSPGERPEVWVDGAPAGPRAEVSDVDGLVDLAIRRPPDGPWDLRVVAKDAPVTVHAFTVGTGAGRTAIVGDTPTAVGQSVELLAPGRLVDGVFRLSMPEVSFRATPPSVGRADLVPDATEGTFDLLEWGMVSDDATMELTPRWARCSPMRVLENGRVLPGHHMKRAQVRDSVTGRVAHVRSGVWFAASDRTPPYANGRRYTLELDPSRDCDGGVWLYPGDDATLEVPAEVASQLHRPIGELRWVVAPTRGATGSVRFEVLVDGERVVERSVSVAELGPEHPVVVRLEPAPRPGAVLAIRAVNEGGGYLIWTGAALGERPGSTDPHWYASF